jgi:hypothetical protein
MEYYIDQLTITTIKNATIKLKLKKKLAHINACDCTW